MKRKTSDSKFLDFPCKCGHLESQHLLMIANCAECDCVRFIEDTTKTRGKK